MRSGVAADAEGHRQAEPGALFALGGIKRLHAAVAEFLGHAGAGVGDFDLHRVRVSRAFRSDEMLWLSSTNRIFALLVAYLKAAAIRRGSGGVGISRGEQPWLRFSDEAAGAASASFKLPEKNARRPDREI